MALTPEDLEALGAFIDSKITAATGDIAAAAKPAENHGAPDPANDTANAPEYFVHLANGDVITSKDSASTHMDVDGKSVAVIGRYLTGE